MQLEQEDEEIVQHGFDKGLPSFPGNAADCDEEIKFQTRAVSSEQTRHADAYRGQNSEQRFQAHSSRQRT